MSGLQEIFSGFGPIGALIGVFLSCGVVWALSHFFSSPGTTVSVLYGLTSYTRRLPSEKIKKNEEKVRISSIEDRAAFFESMTLPFVFDQDNTGEQVYLVLNSRILKGYQYFVSSCSPVLLSAVLEILRNKRTRVSIAVETVVIDDRKKFLVGTIDGCIVGVSLRAGEEQNFRKLSKGSIIEIDANLPKSRDFSLHDAFLVTTR